MRTPLTNLLGIEHPIIQAPMAGAGSAELAAAVSGAGGLGSLGAAALTSDQLIAQVRAIREFTDRPLNLNFFCHPSPEPHKAESADARERFRAFYREVGLGEPPMPTVPQLNFDEARLAALLEIRPAVVSFHFGLPDPDSMTALHAAGCRILSSATTVAEAEHLAARGVDAVIAQGAEAGGHRASFLIAGDDGPIGTFALVPQVVDAVDVPVIAAGGVADGRGLAAALALGAAGAQVGTAFLRCPEATIHPIYREALARLRAEDTLITRALSGRPARALRNRITAEAGDRPLAFPVQTSLTAPLAAAAERGRSDFLAIWAGQGAPLAAERTAADLVISMAAGARRVLDAHGDVDKRLRMSHADPGSDTRPQPETSSRETRGLTRR